MAALPGKTCRSQDITLQLPESEGDTPSRLVSSKFRQVGKGI